MTKRMFGAGGFAVAAGFDPTLHGPEAKPGHFSRGGRGQNRVEAIVTDGYTVGHAGQKKEEVRIRNYEIESKICLRLTSEIRGPMFRHGESVQWRSEAEAAA